ncbi:DUF1484 family protein [Cupriavidus sp. USMAHM13]|uniref:DUF1484 family protein n=1 Tax=Cupriavidus sp. USMAHM13 TaxID=1389192 RepID=UPI0009F36996|nr:DUF1484 family protein [Cupriavidus sp. USMAHM13]
MTARQRRLRLAANPHEATPIAQRLLSDDTSMLDSDDSHRDTILQSCDELLRVSAGLDALLTLLELQAGESFDSNGLHALLLPLKLQMDEAVDRVQSLY